MSQKKFIHAGEVFIATEPTEISTVLGSCVAVCLYDATLQISGMNHFLLPLWNSNGLRTPKFGNIAIPLLIEKMIEVGSQTNRLQAKLFGGANMHTQSVESLMIGKKNILLAHEILEQYRIPIMGEDSGGTRGRKIMMQSQTGKVFMKYTIQDQ